MSLSIRDRVVWLSAASAALPGPVCWGLVAADAADPYTASYAMVVGVVAGFLGLMAAPWLPNGDRDGSRSARLVDMLVLWTIASACAQLGWELPFALMHESIEGVTAQDTWAWIFWAYGIADARYLIADPFVVIMEGFTSLLGGPLELWAIWLLARERVRAAALVALVVGATQWYGTVLYFGVEVFQGLAHVNTANFFDFWLKFLVLNGFWLVMPLVQCWAAVAVLTDRVPEIHARAAATARATAG
ncbi:MAG: EXPERA domain-containing protein [Myxococcota bacterium]